MLKSSADWHGCPIRYGSTVLGDPWSLLILRDLMFKNARHYADFLDAGESISTNILASRLAALEAEGIVDKLDDPEHGARFIYALTDKGLDLVPVLLGVIAWSVRWDERTEVSRAFSRQLARNRDGLASEIVAEQRARRTAPDGEATARL